MNPYDYEQMLASRNNGIKDAEAMWDARATQFNRAQQQERSGFAERVTAALNARNLLSGARILDIGGGGGRYAIPFAAYAEHVTATDISANMLEIAKDNAERAALDNLSYVKLDWTGADLSALGWEHSFDLAFASMCPAIRSHEGLRRMSEVSRGFCLINQFINDRDSLAAYIIKALGITRAYDPHNDRETVQAIFNLLWLKGYEPEITYLRREEEVALIVEEAVQQYAGRYGEQAQAQGVNLETLMAEYIMQQGPVVNTASTLAMILWKV